MVGGLVTGADVFTLGPRAALRSLCCCCWWRCCCHDVSGSLTGDGGDVLPDAAHAHAPLHLDVTALSPPGAPAILHQPVVLAILVTITHNSDGVVLSLGGAACKDSSSILRPGPGSSKTGDDSSVLVHKLLQQLLISIVCPPASSGRDSLGEGGVGLAG